MKVAEKQAEQAGFSLIEAAIALGIAGLLISGIWTAVGAINARMRISIIVNGVTQIVDNMKILYADGFEPVPTVGMVPAMIAAGVVPANLIKNGSEINAGLWSGGAPWSSGFYIELVNLTGTGVADSATITITRVPRYACLELYARLTAKELNYQMIQDYPAYLVLGGEMYGGGPISISEARNLGSCVSPTNNLLFITYSLR